eukprot:scaffold4653_cov53-Cyclotella_meneghiniana.AAC.1
MVRSPAQTTANALVHRLVSSAQCSNYADRWVCDESWYRLTKSIDSQPSTSTFARSHIVNSLTSMAGTFGSPSACGIYLKHFSHACPYNGKKRMVRYFYLHKTGRAPQDIQQYPTCEYLNPLPDNVTDVGESAVTPARSRNRDTAADEDINNSNTAAARSGDNAIIDGANGLVTPAPSGSGTIALTNTSAWVRDSNGRFTVDQTPIAQSNPDPVRATKQLLPEYNKDHSIYWASPEAAILFGFEMGVDVYKGIQNRIEILQMSLSTCEGYRKIVEGDGKGLTRQQIFDLRIKAMYLRRAYDLALQLMGKEDNKRWVKDICLHAINDLKIIGVEVIINPETLRLWNVELRKGAGKNFPCIFAYVMINAGIFEMGEKGILSQFSSHSKFEISPKKELSSIFISKGRIL